MVPLRACRFRSLQLPGIWAGLALFAAGAFAAEEPKQAFDLPADAAEASITRFSRQTHLEVLYASEVTEGVRTRMVKGEMTPADALQAMLAGTGLVVVRDAKTHAFSVRREGSNPSAEPGSTH